jgi:hypothetical protein
MPVQEIMKFMNHSSTWFHLGPKVIGGNKCCMCIGIRLIYMLVLGGANMETHWQLL